MLVGLVLFLTWNLIPSEGAAVTSTIAVSPFCGNHTCAKHGQCGYKSGERSCVCNTNYHGVGNFACIPKNEKYCIIFNDPTIKSFDGSRVRAPGELMTFATHLQTKVCSRKNSGYVVATEQGSCDIRVYLWYCRNKGKFFVCGTVVKIIVFLQDAVHYHTTRISGRARKGRYTFKEEGQRNKFGNGIFGDPIETYIPKVGRIQSVYDHHENFAFVDIALCGVKVGLRPVEGYWNPLITPAGLLVTIADECEPSYLSVEQTICTPPADKGPSLQQQTEALSTELGEPVTEEDLACLKVIRGDINQNFPGAPTNLNYLHETSNSCDKRTLILAIKQCCFILHEPSFINCYDHISPTASTSRDSSKLISLLDECLFGLCSESSTMCKKVQFSIEDAGCAEKIHSHQNTILNNTCNF